MVKATLDGLRSLRSVKAIAALRGKSVEEIQA
jgi:ribosomal protein S5